MKVISVIWETAVTEQETQEFPNRLHAFQKVHRCFHVPRLKSDQAPTSFHLFPFLFFVFFFFLNGRCELTRSAKCVFVREMKKAHLKRQQGFIESRLPASK